MSADLLREAATKMRADASTGRMPLNHRAALPAVAEWLDVTATDVGTSSLAYRAALKVARAYLGRDA